MKKPHQAITKWFDSISKYTVFRNYKKASQKLNNVENIIQNYKSKMPYSKQLELESKLKEITQAREYFSKSQISSRLGEQEKVMSNLEHDFRAKFRDYCNNFKGFKAKGSFKEKSKHNYQNIKNNMSYWAEDILMPERNRLEQNGIKTLDAILGDGKSQKGKYQELIDMVTPYINKDEQILLEKTFRKSAKTLRKANFSETVEYFDKKRDLMLGGAPTDILTGIIGLILSGYAIGTADTKEDRTSRALTVAFPAIAGLGVSTAMTAMLFSGAKGLAYGFASSAALSMMGSAADKYLNPKKVKTDNKNNLDNIKEGVNPPKNQEVVYA